jgi:UDP-galactopyranose mutase
VQTSEDLVLSSVGRELCEIFFRGHTQKQWALDLAVGLVARIPTRTNDDDRYFTDTFQAMPAHGYTKMFEKMLARVEVRLGVDFFAVREEIEFDHLIYTRPIDRFFDYRHGKLPYRSLRFDHEHIAGVDQLQPVGAVKYPRHEDLRGSPTTSTARLGARLDHT